MALAHALIIGRDGAVKRYVSAPPSQIVKQAVDEETVVLLSPRRIGTLLAAEVDRNAAQFCDITGEIRDDMIRYDSKRHAIVVMDSE